MRVFAAESTRVERASLEGSDTLAISAPRAVMAKASRQSAR